MSAYFDAFRGAIAAAHVEGGSLRLRGAQIGVADLRDLAERLNTAADQAVASRPKSERELEQEAEAAQQFASLDEDCQLWHKAYVGDLTPSQWAKVIDNVGTSLAEAQAWSQWDAMEAIIAPMSVEASRADHCPCPYCDGGGHGDVTCRVIICTGGPHYELQWPKGDPSEAVFVSLPWFGRVQLPASDAMVEFADWLDAEGEDLGVFDD